VAWQINFKDEHGTPRTVSYSHNAIGDYRQIDTDATCEPLYTHPAPFTPITADMVKQFENAMPEGHGWWADRDGTTIIETAVHAYMGAKK
jgi:hypothetical protein